MWASTRIRPLFLLALVVHAVAVGATELPTDEHGDYDGSDLIEWIRSHPEGDIHPSVRIGRERPGDPTSINGLFVSSAPGATPIEKGDVIAQIPWDHIIHPDGKYGKYKFSSCRAIYNLAKELNLGDKSKRAPYVRYLLSQSSGYMPGEWSNAGKEFFAEVLGHGELPPFEETWKNHFENEWLEECHGNEDDEMEKRAFWLTSSRDEDTLMVPIYDMANHNNDPDKLNTLSYKPEKAGDAFRFVASKKILPGEQIYNSYNRCNRCSDVPKDDCETFSFYRTPDLFVHFGFVEDMPQSWQFDPAILDSEDSSDDDTEIEFCLERNVVSGAIETFWEEDAMANEADVEWLQVQLKRLGKLNEDKKRLEKELVAKRGAGDSKKMSQMEWESIWRYHDALSKAISRAIETADTEDSSRDEL